MKRIIIVFAIALTISLSCSFPQDAPEVPVVGPTATSKVAPLVDSFFYGYAYVDENNNGVLDDTDPPLKGVIVIVTDVRGVGSSAMTDAGGSAMVWWPAESKWPVTFEVKSPAGSNYIIVGEYKVVLPENKTSAKFLFALEKPAE